ncbi:hypothetical protein JXM67_13860 [candidate division WOR-3 bacterium]|nr:hypothetical protein [candidate division WOR-3 bacterium]
MKKYLVLLSLGLLVQLSCRGYAGKQKEEIGEPIEFLTRQDTAEIVKQTLELKFEKDRVSDWNLSDDTVNIFFRTEVNPKLIPELRGINLILMTREELQQKADKEGDFMAVYLSDPVIDSTKVRISTSTHWVKGKDSKILYLSGGGNELEFIKVNGRWTGKITTSWII